ncbi:putative STAGA complex 65 subunit gamma [Apostichopus japonicus]|uniref:Putative STAGA complex 65 subunit gamma n=1 Tax=Stichopus japonicus TaxID=307972 RepID=A0A2G8L214_STIJA|nr:putative STAGA complex 65 subunit gamma [Apostichopus japonicus]
MKRSSHWGELDPSLGVGATVSLVAPSSSFTKASLEVTVEGPKLTQPSAQQKTQTPLLSTELYRPDVISLHTIQLLKYNHDIIAAASSSHHGDSYKSDERKAGTQSEPSLEELVKKYPPPEQMKIDANGRLPRYTLEDGTVELDRNTARKLSHRAVSTVCAHSGYQTSEEPALETLTDVLNDYLSKVGQLLRVAVDREATSGSTGFQDTLTQVLHEVGMGSPTTLYTFWKKRIKSYHEVTKKRTKVLQNRIQRHKNAIAVTSKTTLSSEDEMPSQIFAESNFKPASVGSTNGASSTADGEEEGTWYGSSSMEMDQLENTVGGGGDNDEDHGEDEVVDSSSYTDSSSQVADVGSTSPWDGYQDTPPPKKKKK